jgi:hypothetical protein
MLNMDLSKLGVVSIQEFRQVSSSKNFRTNFLCHDILAMFHVQAEISGVRNSPATPPSGTHVIHIL